MVLCIACGKPDIVLAREDSGAFSPADGAKIKIPGLSAITDGAKIRLLELSAITDGGKIFVVGACAPAGGGETIRPPRLWPKGRFRRGEGNNPGITHEK